MFPLNHMNNSTIFSTFNSSPKSFYQLFNNNNKQRRDEQVIPITITPLFSNSTSISSSSTQQQVSFEEPYSPKTGIKTAALLGGMLLLVVCYVLWKARTRLCQSSRRPSSPVRNSNRTTSKFDLDYWLKQVDLIEAKEAERNRECLSPYLELPHEEPRDNQRATASWIGDTWRQWCLIQYQQQHQLLREQPNERNESNPVPYRRRRFFLRRLLRRLLLPKQQNPSFLIENSPAIIAQMRPSIVNDNLIPPPEILDIRPRRVASWPRLKSSYTQSNPKLSALQTRNARIRLLKRASQTTTFAV